MGHMISPARSRLGREFYKLWTASTLSNLGDGVALIAAPLLAASITRNPAAVGGLAFAQRLPWLLFPLLAGAIADRIDRRMAMGRIALVRAGIFGFVGVSVVLGFATMPMLYMTLFLLASAETLFDTSSSAVLPRIVPASELPKANARLAGSMTVTNLFLGKPVGSLLFAVAAVLPFFFGTGMFIAAAALILLLRGEFRPIRVATKPSTSLLSDIRAGIKWLFKQRLLRTITVTIALLNVMLVAQNSILVLFVQEQLGVGAEGFGLLVACYGIGGFLASLVAERIIRLLGPTVTLRLAVIIETVVPATLAITRAPLLFGVTYVFFGFHAVVWGSLLAALRQQLTPDELRGRVASLYGFLENGGAAPGALLGGFLASWLGLSAPFWAGAIVGIILIPLTWAVYSKSSISEAKRHALQS